MAPRFRRVHLLIVGDDGTRIVRVEFARGFIRAAAAFLFLLGGLGVAVVVDDLNVRRESLRRAVALGQLDDDERGVRENPSALVAKVRRRLAELRAEVADWNELHAGIWRPLGPEGGNPRAMPGIGGAAVPAPSMAPAAIDAQLAALAENLGEERQRLEALARFMAGPGSMLRAMPSRWPLRGAVNSEFGRRLSPWSGAPELHGGIDIAALPGTSVKAPAGGRVVFAGRSPGYGTTLILDHGRDVRTLFGHLRDISVGAGQRVERGQTIAKSGESGHATGPHLHYEILVRGQPVNPRGYLWD